MTACTAISNAFNMLSYGHRSRVMLERAVAAVKEDKAKALDKFQKGEGGFKDLDLYVWCANASDGILTAHPTNKGKELRDIEGKHGAPFGQEIMQDGSDKPLEKTTFYTKAGDQICGVGYYKG